MVDKVELLPCPFCKKAPIEQDAYFALINGRKPGWFCLGHTVEMSLDEWNTRAAYNPNERLEAENAELRAERDALLQKPIDLAKMDSIDEDASGKMVAYYWWQQAQDARDPNERLSRIATLFDAIQHGDEEHRAWLKEAIDKHFAGEAVPAPKGKGNSERLREALKDARQAIASLDTDALGMAQIGFGEPGVDVYPIRDELLAKIDAALARTSPSGLRE